MYRVSLSMCRECIYLYKFRRSLSRACACMHVQYTYTTSGRIYSRLCGWWRRTHTRCFLGMRADLYVGRFSLAALPLFFFPREEDAVASEERAALAIGTSSRARRLILHSLSCALEWYSGSYIYSYIGIAFALGVVFFSRALFARGNAARSRRGTCVLSICIYKSLPGGEYYCYAQRVLYRLRFKISNRCDRVVCAHVAGCT